MAEALCCSSEATTTLLIGYTPIQMVFMLKKIFFNKKNKIRSYRPPLLQLFLASTFLEKSQALFTPNLTGLSQAQPVLIYAASNTIPYRYLTPNSIVFSTLFQGSS